MPTVLVTGSAGLVGSAVVTRLESEGGAVSRFDLETGDDLRDEASVLRAAAGCDAIVHAGAIAHDTQGTPAEIVAANVLGTWHVLLAAESHRVERVVHFSSAQVFGFAEGEGTPDNLPVDDSHPARAARPYGMSKRLTEEMCEAWTSRTNIPTIVLRPVMILSEQLLPQTDPSRAELGAFVHLDDVVEAVVKSLTVELPPHARVTLCGPGAFDASAAARVLGWTARRGWPSSGTARE